MAATTEEIILTLTKQLYPTGRAFRLPAGGYGEAMHKAGATCEALAWDAAISTLDSMLPDNPRFTEDDATDWERRLAITTNSGLPLENRKLAIKRKMGAPGPNPAKGNYLYLQGQLQAAGFNVWVHENLFPSYPSGWESINPADEYGTANLKENRHGQFRHGQRNHGLKWNNLIVNSLSQEVDNGFNLGGTLACTFFIGGQVLGTYADVPAEREVEFRRLILTIKQVQTVGMLFINYV